MQRLFKHITKALAVATMLVVAFGPLGVVGQTPIAHATTCTIQAYTDGQPGISSTVPANADGSCPTGSNASFVTTDSKGQMVGSDGKPISNDGCGLSITLCLSQMVYAVGPGIATWAASWSAYFFNFIVRISLQSQVYSLTFLTDSWTLVLSLANMFFIFILIYAAFVIMLKAETARTLQTLAWVVAIALVVNFSFFFTRVVIDAGNILGVQFYNAVATGVQTLPSSGSGSTSATPDITQPMMQAMGLQNVLNAGTFNTIQNQLNSGWGTFIVLTVIYIFAAIMFWVLAIALLMVGLKFFLRVVGLWLVLIASPLAFVAQTLGNTRKFFDMWLRTLVSFSLYPAVFLFMFWVLDKFVGQLAANIGVLGNTANGEANFAAAAGADSYPLLVLIANISIRMMFIIMMLYVMLKVADWVIDQAGGIASTFMNRGSAAILGGGLRTAANFGAFAGRNSAGRLGNSFANSQTGKGLLASNRLGVGSALWRGANALGRSTFDVRNSTRAGAAGGLIGTLSRTRDVEVGAGSQKNRQGTEAQKAAQVKAQGEALRASPKEVRTAVKELGEVDGKKAVKAAERERMDAFIERKSGRNVSNLGMPSMGALAGAAALKKALDEERAKEMRAAGKVAVKPAPTITVPPVNPTPTTPTTPPPAAPGVAASVKQAIDPWTVLPADAGHPNITIRQPYEPYNPAPAPTVAPAAAPEPIAPAAQTSMTSDQRKAFDDLSKRFGRFSNRIEERVSEVNSKIAESNARISEKIVDSARHMDERNRERLAKLAEHVDFELKKAGHPDGSGPGGKGPGGKGPGAPGGAMPAPENHEEQSDGGALPRAA